MSTPSAIAAETARRRTFAIISHPDAGKTTLTEKLLLFAGAIHIAGSVKARKATRHATSDWMEIEKQRGISVASSVMQMEYRGHVINLLDTPGPPGLLRRHLSRAHGGRRGADGDRLGERRGSADDPPPRSLPRAQHADHHVHQQAGPRRQGAARAPGRDRARPQMPDGAVHVAGRHGQALRRRVRHPRATACASSGPGEDRVSDDERGDRGHRQSRERRALRRRVRARARRDRAARRAPRTSSIARRSSPASRRRCSSARRSTTSACRRCSTRWSISRRRRDRSPRCSAWSSPTEEKFTGVVFKIQANMDPAHRDRVAFVRVCSGRFERGMKLKLVAHRQGSEDRERGLVPVAAPRDPRGRVARRHHRACPTAACCSSATRSPRARRCSSRGCRSSRPRSSTRWR